MNYFDSTLEVFLDSLLLFYWEICVLSNSCLLRFHKLIIEVDFKKILWFFFPWHSVILLRKEKKMAGGYLQL